MRPTSRYWQDFEEDEAVELAFTPDAMLSEFERNRKNQILTGDPTTYPDDDWRGEWERKAIGW
jgi:hypothetical protein